LAKKFVYVLIAVIIGSLLCFPGITYASYLDAATAQIAWSWFWIFGAAAALLAGSAWLLLKKEKETLALILCASATASILAADVVAIMIIFLPGTIKAK